MSMPDFHQRVVDGTVPPGIRGVQQELGLGDDDDARATPPPAPAESTSSNSTQNLETNAPQRRGRGRMSIAPAWMTEATASAATNNLNGEPQSSVAEVARQFELEMKAKLHKIKTEEAAAARAANAAAEEAKVRSQQSARARSAAVARAKEEQARAKQLRRQQLQDPEHQKKEFEEKARQYYAYYGTRHVQSWPMDGGVVLMYCSAYTEVPAAYQSPPKENGETQLNLAAKSDTESQLKPQPLNPLHPNKLLLVRHFPTGTCVKIDVTPTTGASSHPPIDGSLPGVGSQFEDISQQVHDIVSKAQAHSGSDGMLNELLAIAQRAYPIRVPVSFKDGEAASTADGLGLPHQCSTVVPGASKSQSGPDQSKFRLLNVGQAIEVLQNLDLESVGQVVPTELTEEGGWWPVWSKEHGCYYFCRYSQSTATPAEVAADPSAPPLPPGEPNVVIESSWNAPWQAQSDTDKSETSARSRSRSRRRRAASASGNGRRSRSRSRSRSRRRGRRRRSSRSSSRGRSRSSSLRQESRRGRPSHFADRHATRRYASSRQNIHPTQHRGSRDGTRDRDRDRDRGHHRDRSPPRDTGRSSRRRRHRDVGIDIHGERRGDLLQRRERHNDTHIDGHGHRGGRRQEYSQRHARDDLL